MMEIKQTKKLLAKCMFREKLCTKTPVARSPTQIIYVTRWAGTVWLRRTEMVPRTFTRPWGLFEMFRRTFCAVERRN
jgi:hypothetical protein